jgi:hypothetical protein
MRRFAWRRDYERARLHGRTRPEALVYAIARKAGLVDA